MTKRASERFATKINKMKELEEVIKEAIELNEPLGLLISMPGFGEPEIITNPPVNLEKKMNYYRETYDGDLEHKHAKGIKIIAFLKS